MPTLCGTTILVPSGRAKATVHLTPTPEQYEWTLNHIWDMTGEVCRRRIRGSTCTAHTFARVVKREELPEEESNQWYERELPWQIHLLRVSRLPERDRKRRLDSLASTLTCGPSEPMMLGNVRKRSLSDRVRRDREATPKYYNKFQDRNVLKGKCGVQ